jgi:uncharacterized membrane protein
MYCKWCGKETPVDAVNSVHHCGAVTRPAKYCMGCSAELVEGSAFCYSCATPVGSAQKSTTSSAGAGRSNAEVAGSEPPSSMRVAVPGAPYSTTSSYSQKMPTEPSTPLHSFQTYGTSGLAITSLILSLFFLFGLTSLFNIEEAWLSLFTSLLAVLFGIFALLQIKESNWHKGGRWLAVAGIVIGIWGCAGSVDDILAIHRLDMALTQILSPPPVLSYSAGQTANIPDDIGGFTTMTVKSINFTEPHNTDQSYEVGVNMTICAGPNYPTAAGEGPPLLTLVLSNGTSITDQALFPTVTPELSLNNPKSNACTSGVVTFLSSTQIAPTPSTVEWFQYHWNLPA